MQIRKLVLGAAMGLAVAGMPAVAFASPGGGKGPGANKPNSTHHTPKTVMYVLRGTVDMTQRTCGGTPTSTFGYMAAVGGNAPVAGCIAIDVIGSNFHNVFSAKSVTGVSTYNPQSSLVIFTDVVGVVPHKTHVVGLKKWTAFAPTPNGKEMRVVVKFRAAKGLTPTQLVADAGASPAVLPVFQIIFQHTITPAS